MVLFIEYYELKTANGYEYYFMPVNLDARPWRLVNLFHYS
jgi:hypothetical protein